MQDSSGVGVLSLLGRLPQDDAILAGLGEGQLSEPLHTVDVVAMDVTGREGWEVGRECWEAPGWDVTVLTCISYYCTAYLMNTTLHTICTALHI